MRESQVREIGVTITQNAVASPGKVFVRGMVSASGKKVDIVAFGNNPNMQAMLKELTAGDQATLVGYYQTDKYGLRFVPESMNIVPTTELRSSVIEDAAPMPKPEPIKQMLFKKPREIRTPANTDEAKARAKAKALRAEYYERNNLN